MRTLAHISDIHFGRADPAIAEALIADLRERAPSLVIVSGDLTQRARAWQYRAAAGFLNRLPKPQLIVPGNHDIPLYDVIRRFFFPLQYYKRYISQNLRPIYRDDQMVVIGLNTARSFTFSLNGFWKDGRISEQQLIDLREMAKDLPASLFKIIVTHHPFIPPPAEQVHQIVHGAPEALDVLQECGIDLLLAGHLHQGYSGDVRTHHEAVKRSILSVQAGTATSTRRRGEANTYNWITVEPCQVSIEVRAWSGSEFSRQALRRFQRNETGAWLPQA